MDDQPHRQRPAVLDAIEAESRALAFDMASEDQVGALLATLAASKPGGRLLELGTGTGHGTAWLLSGMDSTSRLDTVDVDPEPAAVAEKHLRRDPRVTFHVTDAGGFVVDAPPAHYDLIYADAWPGKFSHLDETLALLRPGGLYVVDDLLPQPNWPDGHAPRVPRLIDELSSRPGLRTLSLRWASGLLVAARIDDS